MGEPAHTLPQVVGTLVVHRVTAMQKREVVHVSMCLEASLETWENDHRYRVHVTAALSFNGAHMVRSSTYRHPRWNCRPDLPCMRAPSRDGTCPSLEKWAGHLAVEVQRRIVPSRPSRYGPSAAAWSLRRRRWLSMALEAQTAREALLQQALEQAVLAAPAACCAS